MKLHSGIWPLAVAMPLVLVVPTHGQQATFRGLGRLDGTRFFCRAGAITPDGSVVVGVFGFDRYPEPPEDVRAFRWTEETGLVALPPLLPCYDSYIIAYGVSSNGSVIVGDAIIRDGCPDSYYQGFRWTQETGTVGLRGFFPRSPALPGSSARGISADGRIIVGMTSGYSPAGLPPYRRASRWSEDNTTEDGWEIVGPPLTERELSAAAGVSSDGSVVAGWVYLLEQGTYQAACWTQEEGMTMLGVLPGYVASETLAISADGRTVVGICVADGAADHAFRWTAEEGMVALGSLTQNPDFPYSRAWAVSGDGSVVVGSTASGQTGGSGFIWDAEHGMREAAVVLQEEYGLDLTRWRIYAVHAISADGRTLVGSGRNPQGRNEAWIAHLGAPCAADWDASGRLDSGDYFAFLTDFFSGEADFNDDGGTTTNDFFAFLTAFFEGC